MAGNTPHSSNGSYETNKGPRNSIEYTVHNLYRETPHERRIREEKEQFQKKMNDASEPELDEQEAPREPLTPLSRALPAPESTRGAFIRDILEHPDDETPLVIFADWLDDQDNPKDAAQAEIIRLQCQYARLSDDSDSEERQRIRQRLFEIEREHEDFQGTEWMKGGFRREKHMRIDEFIEQAHDIYEHEPISELELYAPKTENRESRRDYYKKLASCPYLACITSLTLSSEITSEELNIMLTSPYLFSVTNLTLANNYNLMSNLNAFSWSSVARYLPSLRELNVHNTGLTDETLHDLLQSPLAGQLTTLYVSHNRLTDVGAQEIAETTALTNLERLIIASNNNITEVGQVMIQASSRLQQLSELRY